MFTGFENFGYGESVFPDAHCCRVVYRHNQLSQETSLSRLEQGPGQFQLNILPKSLDAQAEVAPLPMVRAARRSNGLTG